MTNQEAINEICDMANALQIMHESKQGQALQMAIKALENQKTGHWIDDEFGSKCSCCDIYTHLDKFGRPMKFKHCSMCGAKMKGE